MLFNSLAFAVFLPVVFCLYWFAVGRSIRWQNLLLLVASYVFYGWWDWRFLGLIAFTTGWSFVAGLIELRRQKKGCTVSSKVVLVISLVVNLGILAVFKYCNFFVDSLVDGLRLFGIALDWPTLRIVLPVGISFYTFQALSYTIDVYRKNIVPTKDAVAFFAFISFFPQLVAGPIERATNFLPQFLSARQFDCAEAEHGLCLIVYGLFKKIVVADMLALYVDRVFEYPMFYSSVTCLIAAFFFAIQIYCDFSGYSDCARGLAKLFGFRLMVNFDRPYLSRSFAEFWRRWHISLSSWFKDYVYIPLGGNRVSLPRLVANTWVVFLVSGLWHGAAWTYVVWGAIHALFLTGGILRQRLGFHRRDTFLSRLISRLLVFGGIVLAWIVFRAQSFGSVKNFFVQVTMSDVMVTVGNVIKPSGGLTLLFIIVSISLLAASYALPRDCQLKESKNRILFVLVAIPLLVLLAVPNSGEFIYFQF